jgi:hypothetical protein
MLLSEALGHRRREVKKEFESTPRRLFEAEVAAIARVLGKQRSPISLGGALWYESPKDVEPILLAVASDQPLSLGSAEVSLTAFPTMIRKKEIQAALNLAATRYACPVNFLHPSERQAYEEVLRFLMVVDRAQLVGESEERLRWLLLNLVALRCRVIRDLRGLDLLNYYWEKLVRPFPDSALVWSFFSNYDAALEELP